MDKHMKRYVVSSVWVTICMVVMAVMVLTTRFTFTTTMVRKDTTASQSTNSSYFSDDQTLTNDELKQYESVSDEMSIVEYTGQISESYWQMVTNMPDLVESMGNEFMSQFMMFSFCFLLLGFFWIAILVGAGLQLILSPILILTYVFSKKEREQEPPQPSGIASVAAPVLAWLSLMIFTYYSQAVFNDQLPSWISRVAGVQFRIDYTQGMNFLWIGVVCLAVCAIGRAIINRVVKD